MPRLLDLYCGAGGIAMGYHRVGFEVVGVDIKPQPHYPFEFIQSDALAYLLPDERSPAWNVAEAFHVIHASAPCQAYTESLSLGNRRENGSYLNPQHPDLVAATRELLEQTGLPWVMENIMRAPIRQDLMLCGSMFGLDVRWHRKFESNVSLGLQPLCRHDLQDGDFPTVPGSGRSRTVNIMSKGTTHEMMAEAMGIDWIPSRGMRATNPIRQAIPPAYGEYVGGLLLERIR